MANDPIEEEDDGISIKPRRGLEIFVNDAGTISFRQEEFGQTTLIALHADEVRELLDRLPEFLEKHFPV